MAITTTIPALVFAIILSILIGSVYHLARGGGGWYLLMYFALSALGFAAGQGVSVWRGWILLRFGMLDVGFGVLGAFLFLAVGDWLGKIEAGKPESGEL